MLASTIRTLDAAKFVLDNLADGTTLTPLFETLGNATLLLKGNVSLAGAALQGIKDGIDIELTSKLTTLKAQCNSVKVLVKHLHLLLFAHVVAVSVDLAVALALVVPVPVPVPVTVAVAVTVAVSERAVLLTARHWV